MKSILIVLVTLISFSAIGQKKAVKDSVYQITFTKGEYINVFNYIASKIDSKKETDEFMKFIEKYTAIKPKEK